MPEEIIEAAIFPSLDTVFRRGETSIQLVPIQAMLLVLTSIYRGTGSIEVNGTNDGLTSQTVKNYQKIFGQEQTGEIGIEFWDYLTALYRCNVTGARFRPEGAL